MAAHSAFGGSGYFDRMGSVGIRSPRKPEVTAGIIFRHEHLFLPDRSPDFWFVTWLYLV